MPVPRIALLGILFLLLSGCFVVVPVPTSTPSFAARGGLSTLPAISGSNNCTRPLVQARAIDRSALAVDFYRPTANDGLSAAERQMYEAMMAHRAKLGLPRIPLSKSLTIVAGRHAEDTQKNLMASGGLKPGTNWHSWSDVDYYPDHRNARLMWQAPRRLGTAYCSNGYEISAWGFSTWQQTLQEFIASDYHGPVIENRGPFKQKTWRAVGIGIAEANGSGRPAYHIWFGDAPDPAGAP